ncbi:MAG: glycosyltransferase [Elusimicrobia bacterium]|nr:glycosyltransferase [Elusimicrobiota bacterium]
MQEFNSVVLHVDFEPTFRGAENQLLILHQGLLDAGFRSYSLCREESEFDLRARREGWPHIYRVRSGGLKAGEFDPGLAMGLARITREVKPDIIHAHSAHAAGVALLARSFMGQPKPKLVFHRTVTDSIGPLSRWKYNAADAVVAVCQAIARNLARSGVDERKVKVVYIGMSAPSSCESSCESPGRKSGSACDETCQSGDVCSDGLSSNSQRATRNAQLVCGMIAALDRTQKDVETLLRAWALADFDIFAAQLEIFGDGPDRARLEALARELGIDQQVTFHGWWSRDIFAALKMLDIFVLSSLKEGASNVLAAAMIMGLPCLATDVGGNAEILGGTGILVPPRDARAMAGELKKLLDDPAFRSHLGVLAKARSSLFSTRRFVASMVETYAEILGRSGVAAKA